MILVDLVRKNLVLLARARSSALIVILGPLVLIFLAGLAFDNANVYSVRVASYAPDDSPLVDVFSGALSSSRFRMEGVPSVEACQDAVRSGDAHACMVFSKGFDAGKSGNEITFYVDYSRVNLVSTIVDVLSSEVGLRTTELSRNLSAALIDALDVTRRTVRQKRGTLVTLATENDRMLKGVARTRASIEGLDVTLNVEAFNLPLLNESGVPTFERWESFANVSVPRLDAMLVSLVDAEQDVNGSSLDSATKADLISSIDDVLNKTLLVRSQLNSAWNQSGGDRAVLNASLVALRAAVSDAKLRTDAVATVRQQAVQGLDEVKVSLDRSLLNVLDMQVGINAIDAALEGIRVTDPGTVAQPVKTTVKPVAAERTYLNYLFPSLVVLVIAFTSLLLAPSIVMFERKSTAVFRNFMAPVPGVVFVAASFITSVLVLLAQVLVILLVAVAVFTIPFASVLPTLVPGVILIVLFVLLGLALGFVFETQETVNLAGITLASLFLFLSDVLIPLESMPQWLRVMVEWNPIVLGGSLIRKVLLFDVSLASLAGSLAVIVGYAVAAAGLVLLVHHISSKHVIWKLLHRKKTK